MFKKEKIIAMTKLAIFEKHKGEEAVAITKLYGDIFASLYDVFPFAGGRFTTENEFCFFDATRQKNGFTLFTLSSYLSRNFSLFFLFYL